MAGGVISPATVFPLSWDDHVNNHVFIGDHPPTTVNTPLCQVEVTPPKSEGIEPFTMVNTLPCQVEALPSHPINTPSGHLEDASSPLVLDSVSIASRVPLVKSPSFSWPVTDPTA